MVEDCVTLFEFACRFDVAQKTDNKMQFPCLMFLPGVTFIAVELSPRSQRVDKDHVPDVKVSKKN